MPYELLQQRNPYFRNLSPEGQKKFVDRTLKFMNSKYFIGRQDLEVTDEMRLLISASAVQLTFGLKDFSISHLHTINVFPRAFYSKMFEVSFKGLTTKGGVLSISWDDFNAGYSNYADKLNLGLHELAHALNIDLDESGNYDDRFSAYFSSWKRMAVPYYQLLKQGGISFLRTYGGRNMHEFFAVCVEHFFETPSQFRAELPELYRHMVLMLNQDPENVFSDYKVFQFDQKKNSQVGIRTVITKEEPVTAEPRPKYLNQSVISHDAFDAQTAEALQGQDLLGLFVGKRGLLITMVLTAIGLFFGIPMLMWFSSKMMIETGTILMLLFFLGIAGLLQWRYVKKKIDMQYYQFTMYSFVGFGMCMVNLLLFLNMSIRINGHAETYDISYFRQNRKSVSIALVGANEKLMEQLQIFLDEHRPEVQRAKKITIVFDTGLLGFDMVKDYKMY